MSSGNLAISKTGLLWSRLSLVYLLIGISISISIFIGATQQFELRPIHAHVNLLGWALAAIAGITYCVMPQTGTSGLGRAHFWLHNIGVPVMLISLTMVLSQNTAFLPELIIGKILVAASVVAYLVNLFVNAPATE